MWWTQPKLAVLFIGLNTLGFGAIVVALESPSPRLFALATLQITLLVLYRKFARRLGEQHLAGATKAAFEKNFWEKRWRGSRDDMFAPDAIPRPGGGSFYQRVLGESADSRDALYAAMSLWEGTRLLWIGGTAGLAVALVCSFAALSFQQAFGITQVAGFVASALSVPLTVLVIPEALNVLLLRRFLLRHGVTERAALLVPRSAADLGWKDDSLPEQSNRDVVVAMCLAIGGPVLLVIGLAAGIKAMAVSLLVGIGLLVAVIWSMRSFTRLVVNGIPFINFNGPTRVSVLLDLAHRQRAYLSVVVAAWGIQALRAYSASFWSPLDAAPVVLVGYVLAVTFGDQLSGYAGYVSAARFEYSFKRSMAKIEAAAQ